MSTRLDIKLVELGIATGREKAKQYIKDGNVLVDGKVALKPSFEVEECSKIEFIGNAEKYVGRAGYKLEKAIEVFEIDVKGLACADLGASTGGFTDCLLQNGAEKVYAVDVGHGQISEKLLQDDRVINIEGMNVKDVDETAFGCVDFVCADLSFISVKYASLAAVKILKNGCKAVLLVKPQFEVGKKNISKGGIVKDKNCHITLLNDMYLHFQTIGFGVDGISFSPITGGDGNIEYLFYLTKGSDNAHTYNFKDIVTEAFNFHEKR